MRVQGLPYSRTDRRDANSFAAITAKSPITRPEITPMIGPVTAIISRGESGSGIDAIISASAGWLAMY